MHKGIEMEYLLRGIGRTGLLPIPEGGVRNEELGRGVKGHVMAVKAHARHGGIGELIPVEFWYYHFFQGEMVVFRK
jgi:hypothetical protein